MPLLVCNTLYLRNGTG